MRQKLQYILPSVQMAIAIGLIFWGMSQDERIVNSIHSVWPTVTVAYTAPAWHVCDAISGPLRPLASGVYIFELLSLNEAWIWIISLILIALLWFWVGLNVSSWIAKKQFILPSRRTPRLLCDVLFVIAGVLCAVRAWLGTYEPGIIDWIRGRFGLIDPTLLDGAVDFMATICYLIWAVVLIAFFGQDFVKSCLSGNS